jgi:tetratricopeptide (TPR) repeat protein
MNHFRIITIITLLLTTLVVSQSKSEYFDFNNWYEDTEDSPEIELRVVMHRLGFGYPYVEGMIKSVKITGYYYDNDYYSGNDLQNFGIVFPVIPRSPIASIEFDSYINKGATDFQPNSEMEIYTKVKSSREIPFEKTTKEQMTEYAKRNGLSGSVEVWETYGEIQNVEMIEVTSPTFSEIRSAIRSLLKATQRKEVAVEKREEQKRTARVKKQVEREAKKKKSSSGYAMEYYYKAVAAYNVGDYAQAQRHIRNGLSIDPNNSQLLNLSYKVNDKAAVQSVASGMMAIQNSGISAGFIYNNLSGIGAVLGYHTGHDDYRSGYQPDYWSLLFSAGLLAIDGESEYQTYSLMAGLPMDIQNDFIFFLPDILTISVGGSYVLHKDIEEYGFNIGLQSISGTIALYGVYDTVYEFEFGFFAAF